MNEELKTHIETAHLIPIRLNESEAKRIDAEARRQEAQARTIEAEATRNLSTRDPTPPTPQQLQPPTARPTAEKIATLPRPSIQLESMESDWSFFVSQWKRYVDGTNMTTKAQIQHAWAACEEPLQRAMHNAGANTIADPADLLQLIKSLAVKRRNNLINIIELQRMGQQRGETIKTYSARLNGQADLCDLFVTCNSCNEDVSFKEKTTMYQLIRGLADIQDQERIMEAAAQVEGGELSLTRVLKLAEAFEMGKASQELVNSAGQISRISEHRLKKQDQSRQNNKKKENKDTNSDKPTQCSNCGKTDHTSQLSVR